VAVAQTRRLHFAKRLLDETDLPITQIALAAGFGSLRRFNDAFQASYRQPPRELRKRRANDTAAAGDEVTLRLAFRPPYDWLQVRNFLAARALPGIERVDERGYARTVRADTGHVVVIVRALDEEDALELRVRGAAPAALFQLSCAARRTFDLSADPARIRLAFRSDRLLAPLLKQRPGLRIPGAWDAFECAVRAVLGQQVTVAAARTFAARLVQRAGEQIDEPGECLTHLFPSPAALVEADLVGIGITGARIRALRALARAVEDRKVDFAAPMEEVTAALASLPGLGAWTAQYVALRALAEPDAFPAADLVLRRIASADGKPLSTRALEARAEHWRPWRSYAVLHLWAAAAQARTSSSNE
jgi:AraC family transcriptional regulator of adaptative response / DNA-3-methyladenine glycosylase II